jgi:hypothetical protein
MRQALALIPKRVGCAIEHSDRAVFEVPRPCSELFPLHRPPILQEIINTSHNLVLLQPFALSVIVFKLATLLQQDSYS